MKPQSHFWAISTMVRGGHRYAIVALSSLLVFAAGCHGHAPQDTKAIPLGEDESNFMQPENETSKQNMNREEILKRYQVKVADPPSNNWVAAVHDAKNPVYGEAYDIIVSKHPELGDLKRSSRRFRHWVVVVFRPESPNSIGYIVDMESKAIIGKGDWDAAMPLYEALLATARHDIPTDTAAFYGGFAAITSIIAFGHAQYLEKSHADWFIDPQLELGDTPVFRYDIPHRDSTGGIRCILTFGDGTPTFETVAIMP